MAITDDPLYQAQHKAGLDLLGLYDPAQEEARYARSLGGLKQTLAERTARGGLTGSSEELDALTNAAKTFELDWDERKPAQMAKAITASQLPISNLLSSGSQNIQQEYLDLAKQNANRAASNQDSALLGNVLASIGLPQWLASTLFGVETNPLGALLKGGTIGTNQGGLVGTLANQVKNWLATPDAAAGQAGTLAASLGNLVNTDLLAQGIYPGVEEGVNRLASAGASSGIPGLGSLGGALSLANTLGATGADLPTEAANAMDSAINWDDANAWVNQWLAQNGGGTDFLAGGLTGSADAAAGQAGTLAASLGNLVNTDLLAQGIYPAVEEGATRLASSDVGGGLLSSLGPLGGLLSLANTAYGASQASNVPVSLLRAVPALATAASTLAPSMAPALAGLTNPMAAMPGLLVTGAQLLDNWTSGGDEALKSAQAMQADPNVYQAVLKKVTGDYTTALQEMPLDPYNPHNAYAKTFAEYTPESNLITALEYLGRTDITQPIRQLEAARGARWEQQVADAQRALTARNLQPGDTLDYTQEDPWTQWVIQRAQEHDT